MALLFALLAILLQPVRPPVDFVSAVMRCDTATVEPGAFVGCESRSADGDEILTAGVRWVDGSAVFQTGP